MKIHEVAKPKFCWHVTPTENVPSILKKGLVPVKPEEDGDLAVSFFKTREDAVKQTKAWLKEKFKKPLSLLKVNVTGLNLTETFPYELITTDAKPVSPDRIVEVTDFNVDND